MYEKPLFGKALNVRNEPDVEWRPNFETDVEWRLNLIY